MVDNIDRRALRTLQLLAWFFDFATLEASVPTATLEASAPMGIFQKCGAEADFLRNFSSFLRAKKVINM